MEQHIVKTDRDLPLKAAEAIVELGIEEKQCRRFLGEVVEGRRCGFHAQIVNGYDLIFWVALL